MVELKIIVLNKISQNQKDKCRMFSFIAKFLLKHKDMIWTSGLYVPVHNVHMYTHK